MPNTSFDYLPKKSKGYGGYLIVCSVLVLALIVGVKLWKDEHKIQIDNNTLCPNDGPKAATLILLDLSDGLTLIQKEALRAELKKMQERSKLHEQFVIFSVAGIDEELLEPQFNMCNPGNGKDLSKLHENPTIAKRKWNTLFIGPFNTLLARLSLDTYSKTSPIMESIQSVAVSYFASLPEGIPKRLVIVSDMVQNTEGYSQYSLSLDFPTFKQSPYYQKVSTNYLKGVDIKIFYMRRPSIMQIQGKDHVLFWEQYFFDQSALLKSVTSLDG